ncbi:MAG: Fic family protein [Alphaproteobacteria bacterium]|nr:Fic family protein [Alphaproteobacteria bacterium]
MLVLEKDDPALYSRMQEKNLLRQYDYLTNCIEIGIKKGPTAFDKYTLWALNHIAVANISQFGGRFRQEPIYVGNHIPPHFKEVPDLMDRFISFLHENWFTLKATQLAAYALWRLNWVHPFIEGNGRTARAACYYVLSARTGIILPGRKIVPERIRETRARYVDALRAADKAWEQGNYDLQLMESYLAELLTAQMKDLP